MDLGLQGRRVFITGGSKGIGLACAKGFLAEGARVAIASRHPSNIAAACAELGNDVIGITADFSKSTEAARAVAEVEQTLGPIDVLVNSAGAARRTPPDELTPADWHAAMEAKYFSYIHAIDPVVKRMAARGSGVIVNIIGNGGKSPSPVHLPGGSANAALMLATAGLAQAYAARGVRVVGVNPGLTETDRVAEGFAATARLTGLGADAVRQTALDRIPLGRIAEAREIADVVLFLASDRASYVTGINLTLDGGAAPSIL